MVKDCEKLKETAQDFAVDILIKERDCYFDDLDVEIIAKAYMAGYKDAISQEHDKTMIEKAKAWVKNCFIGPFGEGLADNIANEFVKYLEE